MPEQNWKPGFDCSYDPLTELEATCLIQSGHTVGAQCLWTAREMPGPAIDNLRLMQRMGLQTVGYISINGNRTGAWHVDQARSRTPDDIWAKLALAPIDVELDGIPAVYIRDGLERAATLGQDLRTIYTNYNSWMTKVIFSHEYHPTSFALDTLLWRAYWDNEPDIDDRHWFGGWGEETLLAEQFTGGHFECNHFVDANIFDLNRFTSTPPIEGEDDMTPEEKAQLNQNTQDLAAQKHVNEFYNQVLVKLHDQQNALVCQTLQLQRALEAHFQTHNTSSGPAERTGPVILQDVKNINAAMTKQRVDIASIVDSLRVPQDPA